MADVVSPDKRSEMMSGIQGKNTKPEMLVRKGLFRLGFRFRIHVSKLPGKPDIVLPKYKAVIFINGCFWHGHNCSLFRWPSTRPAFWREKITSNKNRDLQVKDLLAKQGWRMLVLWECATKGRGKLPQEQLIEITGKWLKGNSAYDEIGEFFND